MDMIEAFGIEGFGRIALSGVGVTTVEMVRAGIEARWVEAAREVREAQTDQGRAVVGALARLHDAIVEAQIEGREPEPGVMAVALAILA